MKSLVPLESSCLRLSGLYAITPDDIDKADLLRRVDAALTGASIVQYRDKHRTSHERRACAEALLARCRRARIPLVINDDLALALAINADGVHLGKTDGDPAIARRALDAQGPGKILGVSCYADLECARIAARAGADYLAFGSAFSSSSKPSAVCLPPNFYRLARQEFSLPICAIGGITIENAPLLIQAGVDLIATIHDLFSAANISAHALAYCKLFDTRCRLE